MNRPESGALIGDRYRLIRLIGDGGMGAVYEARHEMLDSPVALKLLHPELARRAGLVERFLREAQVSARIRSPHVTTVTDVARTPDGGAFLVMELLEGETLQAIMGRLRPLHQDQALDFSLQILLGLEAAHSRGVVHRDLKPDNVFVTPSVGGPIVKLLDFGIAKLRQCPEAQQGLTMPGAMLGTPEYMAPEQALSADSVDARADIYSLGAILYEMLSGRRPAEGSDLAVILSQVRGGQVPRLEQLSNLIPIPLAQVVHQAIHPDPTQRFDSARAMRTALARYAGALSQAGRVAATPIPGGAYLPDSGLGFEPASYSPQAGLSSRDGYRTEVALAPPPMPAPISPMGIGVKDATARSGVAPTPAPPRPDAAGLRTAPMPHPPAMEREAPKKLPLGSIAVAALVVAGVAGGALMFARTGDRTLAPPPEPLAGGLVEMDAAPVAMDAGAQDVPDVAAEPEPEPAVQKAAAPVVKAPVKTRPSTRRKPRRAAPRPVVRERSAGSGGDASPTITAKRNGDEITIRIPKMDFPSFPDFPAMPTSFPEFPGVDVGSPDTPRDAERRRESTREPVPAQSERSRGRAPAPDDGLKRPAEAEPVPPDARVPAGGRHL